MSNNPLPPLDQRNGSIWHNGKFVPWKDANIHILTQSLHYSSSVYEGIRIYEGKAFKLKEHLERLLESAKILKLDISYSLNDLIDISNQVISQHDISFGYMRPLIWRGSKSLKIGATDNSIEIMIAAWETSAKDFYAQKPMKLMVSKWIKPPVNVMPSQCKSAGHYNMLIVAKYEAMESGYNDALMLDEHGYISECTTSNIFFVKDSKLYTPNITYALNGITRQTIIEIAKNMDIETIECNISLNDLNQYNECFITGTAAEIQKVTSINNEMKFNDNKLTEELYRKYKELVLK